MLPGISPIVERPVVAVPSKRINFNNLRLGAGLLLSTRISFKPSPVAMRLKKPKGDGEVIATAAKLVPRQAARAGKAEFNCSPVGDASEPPERKGGTRRRGSRASQVFPDFINRMDKLVVFHSVSQAEQDCLAGEERVQQENVRLEERNRIARELHDTLLQTFQGALLHLGVVVKRLPPDSHVKSKLDPIVQFMEQAIEEGRNAIQGLRSPGSRPLDLIVALSAVRQEFSSHSCVDFRVGVVGQQQPLRLAIQDEIYRVGKEALVNAFCHSGAKRIDLELEYTNTNLIIRIRDNGCGIDPRMLDAGREGHWGLAGMRERATRIGARLKVSSSAAHGTEVQLSVPYAVAL